MVATALAIPQRDTRVPCPQCGEPTTLFRCPSCEAEVPQPYWRCPEDSTTRTYAMKIIALRLGGMTDDEIATHIGIKRSSFGGYLYRAGKNGWLDYDNSRDAIVNGLLPKAIRNMNKYLDDDKNVELQAQMTDALMKGTAYKEFDRGSEQAAPSTVVQIKIEQPTTTIAVREGTIGGSPAYTEGETV